MAARHFGVVGQLLLGEVDIAQDDLRMLGEQGARLGYPDAARMPLKQLKSKLFFQLADVQPEGRLRDVGAFRCLGDAAVLQDRQIEPQAPQIHFPLSSQTLAISYQSWSGFSKLAFGWPDEGCTPVRICRVSHESWGSQCRQLQNRYAGVRFLFWTLRPHQ